MGNTRAGATGETATANDGKVVPLVLYANRDLALDDLGLQE